MINRKTAIMIEPRKHRAMELVLRNMNTCLPPEWKIIVFVGDDNYDYTQNVVKTISCNRVKIYNLHLPNLDAITYSKLLASKWFYSYIRTEIFLIFQTDSLINENKKHYIQEYLEYDYVGAPWLDGHVGNGGFSIRKKSKMLSIIDNIPYKERVYEDKYFSNYKHLHKPTFEKAKRFVETVFHDDVFVVHKCWAYMSEEQMIYLKNNVPHLQELIQLQ